MATTRASRVYTISLPPELAQKAEALAKRDSRTMSELFREAFRSYYAQQARRTLEEIGEYAASRKLRLHRGGRTSPDQRSTPYQAAPSAVPDPAVIVVLDTNVSISALQFAKGRGIPTRALQKAMSEDVIATCVEAEAEILRVLTQKFLWDANRAQAALEAVLARSIRVQLRGTVTQCRDPNDDMFLECAARASADLLIAGDKDLLVLVSYKGTRIVTPAEYVSSGN